MVVVWIVCGGVDVDCVFLLSAVVLFVILTVAVVVVLMLRVDVHARWHYLSGWCCGLPLVFAFGVGCVCCFYVDVVCVWLVLWLVLRCRWCCFSIVVVVLRLVLGLALCLVSALLLDCCVCDLGGIYVGCYCCVCCMFIMMLVFIVTFIFVVTLMLLLVMLLAFVLLFTLVLVLSLSVVYLCWHLLWCLLVCLC